MVGRDETNERIRQGLPGVCSDRDVEADYFGLAITLISRSMSSSTID